MNDDRIAHDLGEVKGKLDFLIDLVRDHAEHNRVTHENQDKRLRSLEDGRTEAKGRTSVISGLVGMVAGVAGTVLAHLFGIKT